MQTVFYLKKRSHSTLAPQKLWKKYPTLSTAFAATTLLPVRVVIKYCSRCCIARIAHQTKLPGTELGEVEKAEHVLVQQQRMFGRTFLVCLIL